MSAIVGTSLANISGARLAYRSFGRTSVLRPSDLGLPDAIKTPSKPRILISLRDSRTMVATSLLSAEAIVGALKVLVDAAKLATHSGLVSPSTNLFVDGDTRISRVNLGAGINLTLDRIDKLISKTEFSNANILSSTSASFYLQTTDHGGKIAVTPLPLDKKGLGISDLNIVFKEGAQKGYTALTKAYSLALSRLRTIRQLHDIVIGGSTLDTYLQGLSARLSNTTLPSGAFVNIKV